MPNLIFGTHTQAPAHAIARLGNARTFQHIHLVDDSSVLDNIAVARAGIDGDGFMKAISTVGPDRRLDAVRRIEMAAADRLGVADVAMEPCGGLPYGTRRRVEVARGSQPARGCSCSTSPRRVLMSRTPCGSQRSHRSCVSDERLQLWTQ